MSGLAAIYDPAGRPIEPEELACLLAPMGHRGAVRLAWTDPGIALGALILPTTPEALQEKLPTDVAGGTYQVAFDGRLDNRDEVLTALGTDPRERVLSDSELVILCFERWGPESLTRLVGDFAFVLWDKRSRSLFAARDQRGFRPLFYARASRGLIFGSEAVQLAAHEGVSAEIDQLFLACHLTGAFPPAGQTQYAGVAEVPPAHYLVASGVQVSVHEYWRYGARPLLRYRRREEYVEHFEEIFGRVAAAAVRSTSAPGILLSGGLDSSYVAARAAEFAPDLKAFSAYAPGTESMDERRFSRAVVEHLGLEGVEFDAGDCWSLSSRYLRDEDFDHPEQPMQAPVVIKGCQVAQAAGVNVLLDGVGGDEFFTGNWDYIARLAASGRFTRALSETRAWARYSHSSIGTVFRYGVVAPLVPASVRHFWRRLRGDSVPDPVPPWINSGLLDSGGLGQARQFPGLAPVWRDGRNRSVIWTAYLASVVPTMAWWERRAGLPCGIENRSPLWDLRVLEFALRTPEWVHRDGGRTKMVLRGALKTRVPDEIAERDDKGVFDELFVRGLVEKECGRIEDALVHGPLTDILYVDAPTLVRELETFRRLQHPWSAPLWRAITAGLWLASNQVSRGRTNGRLLVGV